MSKVCEICGKFRPNIQKVTIKDAKGHVRKANVCTKCMKAGKVTRA